MAKYLIESKAGVTWGVYEGDTGQAAWDAMIADAGGPATGEDGTPLEGTIDDWIVTDVTDAAALLGKRVEAGEGDDHDTGVVEDVLSETSVRVRWDSGVRTPSAVSALTVL